jgi:methyltransferase family protein
MRAQLVSLASSTAPDSLAASFRRKRFALFEKLLGSLDRGPVTILDVGGTEAFWEVMGYGDSPHKIILLNLFAARMRHPNFSSLAGDARRLDRFGDQSIDIVFSNSVIEHLGTYPNQQRMADEIRRVGKTYFVQTPNFFFPIEPHFLFPCFHWLPFWARRALIRRYSLGNITRKPSVREAEKTLSEFRLLKRSEIKKLFPEAAIHPEKVFGLTKSYIALKLGPVRQSAGSPAFRPFGPEHQPEG